MFDKKTDGTITVFLSLILILILSLLCTIIEGARVNIAKVSAERAMTTAMDSVMAEYYGPLWNEYHIFGFNMEGDSDIAKKDQLAAELEEYMSYTFTPNKNLEGKLAGNFTELYDITTDKVEIEKEAYLTDYKGQLFINEAVEYMKYKELGDGAKELLDKLSLLEQPKKVSYIMEEKQKVEEELVGIDQGVLELMELYDGLETSDKGIELTSKGKIKTTSEFIKKICTEQVTMENVGINQENIFQAQQEKFVDPNIYFSAITANFAETELLLKQIEALQVQKTTATIELQNEKEKLIELEERSKAEEKVEVDEKAEAETKGESEIKPKSETKPKLETKPKSETTPKLVTKPKSETKSKSETNVESETKRDSNETQKMIESCKSNIESIEITIDNLEEQIAEDNTKVTEQGASIKATEGNVIKLIDEIKPLIENAITCIDNILVKTNKAAPMIEQYESLLNQEKDNMEEDTFSGLEEGLTDLKKYTDSSGGYDFNQMKQILKEDLNVLISTESVLVQAGSDFYQKEYMSSKTGFDSARGTLSTYQIRSLKLDYSTLVLDKSAEESPVEKASNLLKGGILDTVLDKAKISKSELSTSEPLPSEIAAMTQENTDYLAVLSSIFTKVDDVDIGSSGFSEAIGKGSQLQSALGDGVNKVAEVLLYQGYIGDHFQPFQSSKLDSKSQKPSVLSYEQEYLVEGKTSDLDNLASVVSRIVLMRTALDFVSIIGDKEKRTEAQLVATALVGFTGLPILIGVIQALILIVWAYGEALLDTCALLKGMEIPILKKKVELQLPELFLINQVYLEQKVTQIVKTKELSLSYQDYLSMFLLLTNKEKLAYRSMDLIQENIRLRYQVDSFRIKQCLFGYGVNSELHVDSKFIGIAYVQKTLGKKIDQIQFKVEANYSY